MTTSSRLSVFLEITHRCDLGCFFVFCFFMTTLNQQSKCPVLTMNSDVKTSYKGFIRTLMTTFIFIHHYLFFVVINFLRVCLSLGVSDFFNSRKKT